ncbi:MAG: polyprenyl synthetase family protein, partial [Gammaproteobacteria bacterium]|nr:polyprenyl synthetase family protein [Gammaproteobacteria bacterium]
RDKATYPALLGMAEAKRRADELLREAVDSLASWGEAGQPLRDIAGYIIHRQS